MIFPLTSVATGFVRKKEKKKTIVARKAIVKMMDFMF